MAKNYLELVNSVLKRVREDQVGTTSADTYSTLVAEFINDAKQVVEDAWNWSSLRHSVTVTLVPGTYEYDLGSTLIVGAGNALNERSKLLYSNASKRAMAFDITSSDPFPLTEVFRDTVDEEYDLDNVHTPSSSPAYFSVYPTADSLTLKLWENPQAARTWKLYFKRPQGELESDSEEIKVPWRPVVLLATNYALNEKGEEVGQPGSQADIKYLDALANAIALDSSNNSESLVFEPV